MKHTLPNLEYAYDALEPFIDKETMEIHHSKHHQAYVNNLNSALEGHEDFKEKEIEELIGLLEDLPQEIYWAVRNNGGGHYNHSLFWKLLSVNGGGEPKGQLLEAINKSFGNFEAFKETFNKAAATRFGSGWAWLIINKDNQLEVTSTPNQDNPFMEGNRILLGLDVWEHAYYLKYQNKRPDYIQAWWNLVNWDYVSKQYSSLV
ncbi:superoxide dismutase, Fe-Mn family [Natronincola peptidivorans]|uniref:Superoxide dismutase n=1 Tax=Natronincola peptidivorans TaxID=426128 RepID=A0A1I0B007_9FIRM|nr:superoxide dismutase [Natronincola peptidivorans]SES99385.1 superoxide dismutase, Fe-Mn family [Natronincola peptidivorans]